MSIVSTDPAPADHYDAILDLLDAFDQRALTYYRKAHAEAKDDGSAVTVVDRETTTHIQEALRERFPQHGLLIEEAPVPERAEAPYQWVIDPLDGTAMFARGLPIWGLGMGLLLDGVAKEGYLSFPAVGERYVCRGEDVRLNGEPLPPRSEHLPDTRHLLVGSNLFGELPIERLNDYKLRNFGSNLYHLVAVAAGHAEGMISPRCYLWDIVPAMVMLQAAGLAIRYLDGTAFEIASLWAPEKRALPIPQPLVVAPPALAEDIINRLA